MINTKENGHYRKYSKWDAISKVLKQVSKRHNTIPMISKATGISYTAVKNILDDLIGTGVIGEEESNEINKRGRPAKKYFIKKSVNLIVPHKAYDELSLSMLSMLSKYLDRKKLTEFFVNIGLDFANKVLKKWEKEKINISNSNQFVFYFKKELEEEGISNSIKFFDDHIEIYVYNCIFQEAAIASFPLVCLVHETFFSELIKQALGVDIEVSHSKVIAKGDSECYYKIKFKLK